MHFWNSTHCRNLSWKPLKAFPFSKTIILKPSVPVPACAKQTSNTGITYTHNQALCYILTNFTFSGERLVITVMNKNLLWSWKLRPSLVPPSAFTALPQPVLQLGAPRLPLQGVAYPPGRTCPTQPDRFTLTKHRSLKKDMLYETRWISDICLNFSSLESERGSLQFCNLPVCKITT